jgi:hypothetical protein
MTSVCYAQKWKNIDQKYYGMKYKLPANWAIDGFGQDDDWDANGSSVCECAGTINTFRRFEKDEILMVAYPFENTKGEVLKDSKRMKVWDMQFDTSSIKKSFEITGKYARFQGNVGSWVKGTEEDGKVYEVWRLTTKYNKQSYVLYFWANPAIMEKEKKTIYSIVELFQPVRRK